MLAGLAGTFKSFQASLLSGGMIVFVIYIFLGSIIQSHVNPQPAILQLSNLSPYVPLIAALLAALLIGSLYTTALEGVVDWAHRRSLAALRQSNATRKGWVMSAFSPLSDAAVRRLDREAELFFASHHTTAIAPGTTKKDFVHQVKEDTLWMEGKLVGTPLLRQYNAFRSEGEIQVASALLLPPTIGALSTSMGVGNWAVIATTLLTVALSIKLLDDGLYYYRRANSLVAHHVADGAVLTPVMETLRRSNPKTRPMGLTPTPALGTASDDESSEESYKQLEEKMLEG